MAEGLRRAWAAEPAKAPAVVDVYYVLSGNTYAYRQVIAGQYGAEWHADSKTWTVDADRKGRCPEAVRTLKGLSWRRVEVMG